MSLQFAQALNALCCVRTVTQHGIQLRYGLLLIGALLVASTTVSLAADSNIPAQAVDARGPAAATDLPVPCLPDGSAFLRARLNGSIDTELSWTDRNLSCAGSVRPNAEGLRLRFASAGKQGESKLVLLFGITGLKEGVAGKALPANLTIMREGTGEFYGTQGDNKCTVDEISQEPLKGIPLRQRAYRVIARGFCTQPARALNGNGMVLVTRFDFAGRVDFVSDDAPATSTSP